MLPPLYNTSHKGKSGQKSSKFAYGSTPNLPQIPETHSFHQISRDHHKLQHHPSIKRESISKTKGEISQLSPLSLPQALSSHVFASKSRITDPREPMKKTGSVTRKRMVHSLSDSMIRSNADISNKLHLINTHAQRERRRKWTDCIRHVQQVRDVDALSEKIGNNIQRGLLEMTQVLAEAHEQRRQDPRSKSWNAMSESIDGSPMDHKLSNAELNELQSIRSLDATQKHQRSFNEYIDRFRRLDHRVELNNNVNRIRKRRRREIGGSLIAIKNVLRAGNRSLLDCDHQKWLQTQSRRRQRTERKRLRLQQQQQRRLMRSHSVNRDHQQHADTLRAEVLRKRAVQSKVQRRWISLVAVTIPRIARFLELFQNEQDVKQYLDRRNRASVQIQRWFREKLAIRKALKYQSNAVLGALSSGVLMRTESQRRFQLGMNRSADIIKHFINLLVSSNPTHFAMRQKSYHFKQQVIRLQRWWRCELNKKRQIKLQLERQWHREEKWLKQYAENSELYFHSIPKKVRKKVVSDLIERHRRAKRLEYRHYLIAFREHRKKSKFNIKWVIIKRQMGVPPVEDEYVHLFSHNIRKPVLEFTISTPNIRKLIQKTSKKQMLYDMQQLLGANMNMVKCK